ncbi:MAG TPA: hypothetical protein VMK65_01635 [Longimicrobiales bacterium]|nr:hypothetical protein [Longimicrobiales bacterium]
MQARHSWPLAVALFALVGCDGDSGTTPDTLTRAEVAGLYTVTELTFDPQGSLEVQDLLPRLDAGLLPQLVLSRTTASAQLSFRDPDTGLLDNVAATYTLLQNGVRVAFPATDTVASKLLFPLAMTFTLAEGEADPTLHFDQNVSVSLARLRALVPELQDEPLSDPVPGQLRVTFELDQR